VGENENKANSPQLKLELGLSLANGNTAFHRKEGERNLIVLIMVV
jgi:hypothetical protein